MSLGVKLVQARGPATQEAVTEAERLQEVRIPDEYRRFLLQESNGGRPEECIFSREDWPQPDEFLGVGPGRGRRSGEDLRALPRPDAVVVPAVRELGRGLVELSLRDEDRGAVLFWFHEEEVDEGEPPTERNLYPIAGGFEEFAAGLRPIDEVDVKIDRSKVEGVWVDPKFAEEMRRKGLMD
jgi:hypothetical protein